MIKCFGIKCTITDSLSKPNIQSDMHFFKIAFNNRESKRQLRQLNQVARMMHDDDDDDVAVWCSCSYSCFCCCCYEISDDNRTLLEICTMNVFHFCSMKYPIKLRRKHDTFVIK